MSPVLASDGAIALLALLLVRLARMLAAVIRAPEQETPAAREGPAGQPATTAIAGAADTHARVAATIARAAVVLEAAPPQPGGAARTPVPAATSQPRPAGYTARHAGRRCPAARHGNRRPGPRPPGRAAGRPPGCHLAAGKTERGPVTPTR